jgi:hypothetical protein
MAYVLSLSFGIATGGPPWSLPSVVYLAHLTRPGRKLPYGEDDKLVESEIGEPSDDGLIRIEHYQPKETHKAGYTADGKMTDWISIWTKRVEPIVSS